MVNRILLTSLAAICAAAPLFTPVAASARAGASGGGFHAGFRPSFHAAPPLTRAFPARIGDFRRPFVRDRRVGRVLVWPGSGSFDPYYYYPSDDAAPYEGATEGISAPQPRARVMVYTPGCRTQTQTVPSESGGSHTVNITRCY